jgi:hypothetical protein
MYNHHHGRYQHHYHPREQFIFRSAASSSSWSCKLYWDFHFVVVSPDHGIPSEDTGKPLVEDYLLPFLPRFLQCHVPCCLSNNHGDLCYCWVETSSVTRCMYVRTYHSQASNFVASTSWSRVLRTNDKDNSSPIFSKKIFEHTKSSLCDMLLA